MNESRELTLLLINSHTRSAGPETSKNSGTIYLIDTTLRMMTST
jgi:hypothetical protein